MCALSVCLTLSVGKIHEPKRMCTERKRERVRLDKGLRFARAQVSKIHLAELNVKSCLAHKKRVMFACFVYAIHLRNTEALNNMTYFSLLARAPDEMYNSLIRSNLKLSRILQLCTVQCFGCSECEFAPLTLLPIYNCRVELFCTANSEQKAGRSARGRQTYF